MMAKEYQGEIFEMFTDKVFGAGSKMISFGGMRG